MYRSIAYNYIVLHKYKKNETQDNSDKNIVFLWYERKNQLDRLGKGTYSDNSRVLSPAPVAGVVLLSVSPVCHYRHLLFSIGLFEERQRKRHGKLEEVLVRTYHPLFII